MKQWQFTKSGVPRDVLTMAEVPIPTTCADDEILVQVSHISLTSSITYRFIAHYGVLDPVGALLGRPCVPEVDFSGIVCDLRGKDAKEFKIGTMHQWCLAILFAHASIVSCKVIECLEPPVQDFETSDEGCCASMCSSSTMRRLKSLEISRWKMPPVFRLQVVLFLILSARTIYFLVLLECVGYTAYCFLVEKAKLKEGDKVFINGGSGAVGVTAIQLARTIVGSTGLVVATCSPTKSDIVRNLGADEVCLLFNLPPDSWRLSTCCRSSITRHTICRIIFGNTMGHVHLMWCWIQWALITRSSRIQLSTWYPQVYSAPSAWSKSVNHLSFSHRILFSNLSL